MRITTKLAALAALAALAGCGTAASTSTPPSTSAAAPASTSAAAPASTAPPPLTCSTVTTDNNMTASQVIAQVVKDQKSQDASLEQNWVGLTDGSQTSQGNDLSAAADALGNFSGTQLSADGSAFATDVGTFLTDQGGGLLPGWVTEYRAIQHDIAALAGNCGVSYTVPAGE